MEEKRYITLVSSDEPIIHKTQRIDGKWAITLEVYPNTEVKAEIK